ncbi:aconitase X [Thermofilum sp.]|uniref:aconitase X n=2 Tax=Thermofilum sp. TaxID=1961369 RepID=UPI0031680350
MAEKYMTNDGKNKTMEKLKTTLEAYGKTYGANRMLPCKSCHFVTSCGLRFLDSMFSILHQLVDSGLTCKVPLTANPRPLDTRNYPFMERILGGFLYSRQRELENLLLRLGLIDPDAFTCTPYYIGNKPSYGDIIAWAESSAVIYANSVLGARTNRNSSIIEIFSGILGETPEFGLLLDENRKATWLVEVKTPSKPDPFILGSLIGKTVGEDVPYIVGLEKWELKEYELKDLGSAMASWGAVGLFHAGELTAEAREEGPRLIRDDHKHLVVDDAKLKKMEQEMTKGQTIEKPDLIVIGCPHLSREQIHSWVTKLEDRRFNVRTFMLAAPRIVSEIKNSKDYDRLKEAGVRLSSICPLMFTNIPTSRRLNIATTSGKLAYYSHAVFFREDTLIENFTVKR